MMKTPKSAAAARTRDVLIVKKLNKPTIIFTKTRYLPQVGSFRFLTTKNPPPTFFRK